MTTDIYPIAGLKNPPWIQIQSTGEIRIYQNRLLEKANNEEFFYKIQG
jgi:hypothetical protein